VNITANTNERTPSRKPRKPRPATVMVRPFQKGDHARVAGVVVAQLPYARVVAVDDPLGGKAHIVQTSLAQPTSSIHQTDESSRWWTTVTHEALHDGRETPRSRKIHPMLVRTTSDTKRDAVACMHNASQRLTVFAPLAVRARDLVNRHNGQPPFDEVREFLCEAKDALASLNAEVNRERAMGKPGATRRASWMPYGYACEGLYYEVVSVLLATTASSLPVAFDGEVLGVFDRSWRPDFLNPVPKLTRGAA
jgi:hypothetical protein